jgi:hypothetical protein
MKRGLSREQFQILKSVLRQEIGWRWPLLLASSLIKKNKVVAGTRWAENDDDEALFVRRIAITASLFKQLIKKADRDRAFRIMRKIVIPAGCSEQWEHIRSLNLQKKTGMEGLMAFHVLMDRVGAPKFNTRNYVEQDDTTCHFIITRCVFNDFFSEAGVPELTQLFCEVDSEFFPAAFTELTFHRGGDSENTIAYGKDHCEFIFEKKS